MKSASRLRGFTLVELLVVITIIGILIALLLPAVQAAREAARRLQCTNNLKQMGVAVHNCIELTGHFPAGGCDSGTYLIGDSSLGMGGSQTGGWLYNILPFMEQNDLYHLGDNGDSAGTKRRLQTPMSWAICPSRRGAILYPNNLSRSYGTTTTASMVYADTLARSDYAACEGIDSFTQQQTKGDGVVFMASALPVAEVSDGLSNTYFAGEKSMPSNHYLDGVPGGDDDTMWAGNNIDSLRGTYKDFAFQADMEDYFNEFAFGGPHLTGCHMLFCDGSVQQISYSIASDVYQNLGNRHDGKTIDAKNF